jgi:hypothetical protein
MNKFIALFVIGICLSGCVKPQITEGHEDIETVVPFQNLVAEHNNSIPPLVSVEEISVERLVGKWLLLDSEGEDDGSGNYLLVEDFGQRMNVQFKYQGYIRKCTLLLDGKEYFIVSEKGEKYKISRVESAYSKEHNGIGLALITGFDDISLGIFQREDVLEKLKNE